MHIGVHKTGTSALQYFLNANQLVLRKAGIFYQPSGQHSTNHTGLAFAMRKGNTAQHQAARNTFNGLVRAARERGCNRLLLSSEGFTGQRMNMDIIRSLLEGHEATVIAYMRSADDLVASAFNQVVRDNALRWTRPINVEPFAYDPSYSLAFEPWMEFMAPDRLILAPYDVAQFYGRSILRDFLHMLGVKDVDEFDFGVPPAEANSGMAAPLIELLRLLNRIPLSGANHIALVAELRRLEMQNKDLCVRATKSLLTTAERRLLRLRTEANLEKFRPYFRAGFDDGFLRSDTVAELQPDQVRVQDPERELSSLVLFHLLEKQHTRVAELEKRLAELVKSHPHP
jgi:hypothetical protein